MLRPLFLFPIQDNPLAPSYRHPPYPRGLHINAHRTAAHRHADGYLRDKHGDFCYNYRDNKRDGGRMDSNDNPKRGAGTSNRDVHPYLFNADGSKFYIDALAILNRLQSIRKRQYRRIINPNDSITFHVNRNPDDTTNADPDTP